MADAAPDPRAQFLEKLRQCVETLSETFEECEALSEALVKVSAINIPDEVETAIRAWHRVSAPVAQHCLDKNIEAIVQANIPELAPFGVADKYAALEADERQFLWEYVQSMNQLSALYCTTVPPVLQALGDHANKFIAELGLQPDSDGNVPGFNVNQVFESVVKNLSERDIGEMLGGMSQEGGGGSLMAQLAPLLGMFAGGQGEEGDEE